MALDLTGAMEVPGVQVATADMEEMEGAALRDPAPATVGTEVRADSAERELMAVQVARAGQEARPMAVRFTTRELSS